MAVPTATMALAGGAPKRASIGAATRRDLARRMGGGRGARFSVAAASNVFGAGVVHVVQTRDVPLGGVDSRLKGVVAIAHEPVMVGASGGRASVMGAMPHPENTDVEVQSFVESLLEHGRIDLGKSKAKKKSAIASSKQIGTTTHAIKTVGGKKVLRRIRFQCRCLGCL